jgi:hypothetical protein
MHFKLLEKQEQAKPKSSTQKEIIKIRIKTNELETKRMIQRTGETKSWFSEKTNKIDKPLAKLTKRKREEGPN